jgi:hypothetical protein
MRGPPPSRWGLQAPPETEIEETGLGDTDRLLGARGRAVASGGGARDYQPPSARRSYF